MLSVQHPMADSQFPGPNRVAIPRSQVGIERLPARRQSNEPRESMNCKSCRKRKIKCNRLRPSCEACQLFQCPCVYDAVPKKRGPKTDVLEALLKRVDGLEAKLKEKNAEDPEASGSSSSDAQITAEDIAQAADDEPAAKRHAPESKVSPVVTASAPPPLKRTSMEPPTTTIPVEALFSTYFSRFHAKPYSIVDESTVRQRLQLKQLPDYLRDAISAVAARFTPHPHGHAAALKLSDQYAFGARAAIDVDEPSVDALQALLLLVLAFTAAGKGKKAFMAMSNAVGMATALELHRELDAQAQATSLERETRRRLFWACYLLDRFVSCGSKRPCLISDDAIVLRLPSWSTKASATPIDGEFFHFGSNLQYMQGNGKKNQGGSGMLIDIVRILGITNRYLAAGGVKGDSHFPWHSLSNLSKIRQDLDIWAAGAGGAFSNLQTLFGQQDATSLVLSKLIFHLVHCLIYRPFLPIDLAELAGNGQHQSWQIEATNMCFVHANAIAELVDLGRQMGKIEWPAIVGYCVSTAGTVHVHGAHYNSALAGGSDMSVFLPSADFLSREIQQLTELRYPWACVEQQRAILQTICGVHSELVNAINNNAIRYTPGFQLEDFFDRYASINTAGEHNFRLESANLTLKDVDIGFMADSFASQALQAPPQVEKSQQKGTKRKNTGGRVRPEAMIQTPPASYHHRSGSSVIYDSPTQMATSAPMQSPADSHGPHHHVSAMRSTMDTAPATSGAGQPGLTGYAYSPSGMSGTGLTPGSNMSFNPSFNYATGPISAVADGNAAYDPMFGGMATNAYGSPATWQGMDGQPAMGQAGSGATAASPSTKSNTGSTGTQGEEKDPFLTLLEQLAENEQRFQNGNGGELDFFLAGAGQTTEAR